MFSITSVLIGLAMIVVGVGMVKYTFAMTNFTGRQDWMERYTGQGSTYGMYKIIGCFLVALGILYASGFGGDVINWMLSPLKVLFAPLKKVAN